MADPVNPTTSAPEPTPPDDPPRRSASTLLWILLLLAILIGAWYFFGQRDAERMPPDATTPIGETTPVPSESPVSTEPAPRERSPTRERAAPPEPATRDARAISQPAPEYPASAQRAGEEGTVILHVTVDASGNPSSVEIAKRSRSPDLDRAALRSVRTWKFEPATRDGKAVASTVQVPVDFRLDTQ